jgi:hypothetical protein
MDLLNYIKRNYETPNPYIIKDLGGSEELIEYLRNTPWNTNLNMLSSLGSGGSEPEVWLVGDTPDQGSITLHNVDDIDHIEELFLNSGNYTVFLNGEELFLLIQSESLIAWADSTEYSSVTKSIQISGIDQAHAAYMDPSTAPTSVEVSVKAK